MRHPDAAWSRIASESAGPQEVLLRYAVPWSLLPSVAWPIGLALFPDDIGGEAAVRSIGAGLVAGLVTFLGSLLTVCLLAGAIAAVAPMYGLRRSFPGALRVAAFAMTPVWMAGILLVKPALLLVLAIAALHTLVLLQGGLRLVLHVKPGEADEYVAVSVFLTAVASTLIGGLLSFFRLL